MGSRGTIGLVSRAVLSWSIAALVVGISVGWPVPLAAQECVTLGACFGANNVSMCGTSTAEIKEGEGCNFNLNCQTPKVQDPVIEIEPLPVAAGEPPQYHVSMVVRVEAPYNHWAEAENNAGQLVARWSEWRLEDGERKLERVSGCNASYADKSKVVMTEPMTCSQMWSARSVGGKNPGGGLFSLVLATCGPACKPGAPNCFTSECHRWKELPDLPLLIPDDYVGALCPVQDDPCFESKSRHKGKNTGPGSTGGSGGAGAGASLRYRQGGVGRYSPGSSEWNQDLGRFWAHEYAQRLIFDAVGIAGASAPGHKDDRPRHAWLITGAAIYREFWDTDGDGVLEKSSPTSYRAELVETLSGWELRELSGTVKEFDAGGRWLTTRDRRGFGPVGTYTSGKLTEVAFPDRRREIFTYHDAEDPAQGGRLASITEVGVDGETYGTWSYTWDGLDLVRIDLPDGTAWIHRYEDLRHPGYMTQARWKASPTPEHPEGQELVDQAWEYDDFGNVERTWRGAESFTDVDAADTWAFAYEEPWNPVEMRQTDPLGNESLYVLDRDPGSNTPLPRTSTSECSTCTGGPNSQQFYEDPRNPTRVTRSVNARGTTTLFEYDDNGQLLSQTEAFATELERTTTWQYADARHPTLPTTVERPSTSGGDQVRRTSKVYDDFGNVTQRIEEGFEHDQPFRHETVMTYNAAGLLETIDPAGDGTADVMTYHYDPARGDRVLTGRTNPLVGTTAYVNDGLNRRVQTTDVNTLVSETEYDVLSRVERKTLKGATPAEDVALRYTYTPFGDLHRTVRPEGNAIENTYDAARRLISVERQNAAGQPHERIVYTLNAMGHRIREERQSWTGTAWVTEHWVENVYKTRCQVEKVVHADGSVTESAYDCMGNLQYEWDANHPSAEQESTPTRIYELDTLNRLSKITQPWVEPGGEVSMTARSYAHNVQDKLVRVVDGNGNVYAYGYSDRGLLTRKSSDVAVETLFWYDEKGKEVRRTNGKGITSNRTYDALGRLQLKDFPTEGLDVEYVYGDPAVPTSFGRLVAMKQGDAVVEYAYDRFGRPVKDGALGYGYDKNSNRTRIAYPGDVAAVYTYDAADRQQSLRLEMGDEPPKTIVGAASYKSDGPLEEVVFGNGLVESREHSARYFTDAVKVPGRLSWTYSVDAMGNILSITDSDDAGQSRTYGYRDFQYFLEAAEGPWGSHAWTYDKAGNRLSEDREGQSVFYDYEKNALGTNSVALRESLLSDGTSLKSYRSNVVGNLLAERTRDEKTRYIYDDQNRLSKILSDGRTSPGLTTELQYDGRGFLTASTSSVRALKTDIVTTELSATYGSRGRLYHKKSVRHPGPASPRGFQGTSSDSYLFYLANRPVAQIDVSSGSEPRILYLSVDHLGAPALATDEEGQTVWKGGFGPYGEDLFKAQDEGLFLRLPGQWSDESWQAHGDGASGDTLQYNLSRWFSGGTGRYLQLDPVSIGYRDEVNGFLYALANPVSNVDPLGLVKSQAECCPECTEEMLLAELQEATQWLDKNGKKYGSRFNNWNCKRAALNLQDAFERAAEPKCWITSVQLIPIMVNAGVHYVVKMSSCSKWGNDHFLDAYIKTRSGALSQLRQLDETKSGWVKFCEMMGL